MSLLDEIRARWEKATKGPWKQDLTMPGWPALGSTVIFQGQGPMDFIQARNTADAEFIAHSWQDAKTLLELTQETSEMLLFAYGVLLDIGLHHPHLGLSPENEVKIKAALDKVTR